MHAAIVRGTYGRYLLIYPLHFLSHFLLSDLALMMTYFINLMHYYGTVSLFISQWH